MGNIGKAIGQIFTPAGTGAAEAAASSAAAAALTAQTEAKHEADIAAAGPDSSEAAMEAKEARLRLLLAATGANATFMGGAATAPNVGAKLLTGS